MEEKIEYSTITMAKFKLKLPKVRNPHNGRYESWTKHMNRIQAERDMAAIVTAYDMTSTTPGNGILDLIEGP